MSMLSMADARIARQRRSRLQREKGTAGPREAMPPALEDAPDRAHAMEQPGVPGEGPVDRPTERGDEGFQGNANQLVRYIPTEILGAYVLFVGILSPLDLTTCHADFTSRWYTYLGFVVATPIVQYLIYRARVKQATEAVQFPVAECVVATVAFAAWAGALPGSPFLNWCAWSPEYGSALAAALAVLLVLVANAFDLGLRPREEERA